MSEKRSKEEDFNDIHWFDSRDDVNTSGQLVFDQTSKKTPTHNKFLTLRLNVAVKIM